MIFMPMSDYDLLNGLFRGERFNELFQVTVIIPTSGNVSIGPYHHFALEIKPPDGPVLPIERTVPGRISQYVNLY